MASYGFEYPAEELVPCTEDQEQVQLRPKNRTWRVVAGSSLALLTAGSALALASSRGNSAEMMPVASLKYVQGKATWEPPFESQCPAMQIDQDSVDESGWGFNIDHIPNPEVCCALCQGVPKCKSFTWVKNALPDGCKGQCWLKGGVGQKKFQEGFVSGEPPQRKQLGFLPETTTGTGTKLFCFSLMVPRTGEQDLLKWQADQKASIFACDEVAVYSNETLEVGGVTTTKIDSDLKCGFGGDSGTALNAWIFIALFKSLLDEGQWKITDWTVKADPDAVFFPDRLVNVLKEHQGVAYVNNCRFGMHGPIEVFGKPAIEALDKDYKASWDGKSPNSCTKPTDEGGLDFGLWGEDMFLAQCLNQIGVPEPPIDSRLMCEDHCECPGWYWCNNGTDRVSYHPFKTVDSYKNCMANAGVL